MIHIIFLAAGQARRYGSNKLLADYCGKKLYRHALGALTEAAGTRTDCTLTVVTCWDAIESALAAEGIRTVPCHDSHLGISYSIRAGIRSLGTLSDDDYLCFCAADQPNLTAASVIRLLDTTIQKPLTACLSCGDHSGNPVLFSAVLADELCTLEGDRGGKAVMRRHPENHVDVLCDAVELTDVDYRSE